MFVCVCVCVDAHVYVCVWSTLTLQVTSLVRVVVYMGTTVYAYIDE